MQNKSLTLTLVIPVYNEERHIKSCLISVAQQSEMPDEVLVIDNNCTDKTAAIAREFPFVRVVHESTQGLIAARNCGFNAASGELIARIDADAVLHTDWVKKAKKSFEQHDLMAVTGLAYTDTIRGSHFKTRLWSWVYFMMREADFGIRILWGANMVIRKTAWEEIKPEVCLDDSAVHEDQDMSFLLNAHGLRVGRNNHLLITTPGDEYNEFHNLYEYMVRAHKTKVLHKKDIQKASKAQCTLIPVERIARLLAIIVPGVFFILFSVLHLLITGGRTSARYK